MEKMKIDIWSDIACPYCYIGKRKLEMALEQFPDRDKVELVWHSYELDPDIPQKSLDISIYTYFANKYGLTEADAHKSMSNTAKLAEEVGLNYNYDNLVVANTARALRLVKLAGKSGLATEAEEVLFDAYFVKGKDISDKDTLVALGVSIGLDGQSVVEMLEGNDYKKEVTEDTSNADDLEYIPYYVFNNKRVIQGSIPVEDYLKVLNEAYAEWKQGGVSTETGEVISGQSCSIDGICS
ncbi:DsbA family oxidoreductase [Dysgonomonas sp. 511]|uniref:DsbA family oxidoreductase n=1 Tax=Dysgonomonas sp. 511 TaxID=2302930 RepID=UPI0013D7B157|nr:DsbA family oxidoreductase [Dysgonomonas sp. 511]NDV79666.1 DsbA family oxidoreductase [Dysgonomonas sp. 511]